MSSADDVLAVVGGTLTNVMTNLPVVGVAAGALFGLIWGKLQTASPKEDVTKQFAKLIDEVKQYIDSKLEYSKEEICNDAMAFFTSRADELKVALQGLPDSAREVIDAHHSSVNQARDALDVLDDKEYGHLTIHNYAIMASLYLTLLDDGINDKDNWGVSRTLKNVYLDKRNTFFKSKQFSNLLGYTMDKAGQGNIQLRRLSIKTAEVTKFWYCFNPDVYPLGIPEILEPPSQDISTNKTNHVYLQPPQQSVKCVVNNMPGGYVRQVLAKKAESSSWHPYYPGHTGRVLQLKSPDGNYPKTVEVRYYRIANAVATKFIGLDHEIKVALTNGSTNTVTAAIPGEGAWKGTVIFDTEAVVLNSEHPTDNVFKRGVGDAAKLEYVQLGKLKLEAPCDVTIEWKPTAHQQRSQPLLSAVELMLHP